MAETKLPRDRHDRLSAEEDSAQRGRTQSGGGDVHEEERHRGLPPVNPGFRPSNTVEKIDVLLRESGPRRRTQTLFPYLMIRAAAGDRGARPLWPPTPCWESCDIHLLPEGAGQFDFGRTVLQPLAGQRYRIFVHLWNLGRFAVFGGRLRVWWVEPGWFNGTNDPRYEPHFIGGAYFDIGDRDSGNAHRLVEVGTPWSVLMNHEAHECLIAVVECATDPWDGDMNANTHRHVAQRNINLVSGSEDLAPLVGRLGAMMSDRESELLIGHASVGRANIVGARERGTAGSNEAPAGWNHSALTFGRETQPLAILRRESGRMRYIDLRRYSEFPAQGTKLPKGTVLRGGLDRELAALLRKTLAVNKLTGSATAAALGGGNDARVLRFVATERKGARSMGYSVVVAP